MNKDTWNCFARARRSRALAARRRHARRARPPRFPPGPARRGTLAPVSPCVASGAPVHDVGQRHAFPFHPLAGAPPLRLWPGGRCTSLPPPTAHAATRTTFPRLGAQVSLSTALSAPIKRGVAVLLRATQRHQAAIAAAHGVTVNPCSGRLHRPTVPLLPSSCTTKASTPACWPDRAISSSGQSFQRRPPPVSAVPAHRSSPRRM
jgi:hypothetical protein